MMRYSRIIGTGGYLPDDIRTNDFISQTVDTSDSWIFERTGIKSRRIAADHETASSMAEVAARQALEMSECLADEIDLIIVATGTPDLTYPSTACLLQKRLGIKNCAAFDIQAACSGSIFGLSIADQYIKTGAAKKVLIVGTEICSRIVDWTDRTTCILFGDGAGAIVLEASKEPGILSTALHADGSQRDILCVPGRASNGQVHGSPFMTMDGQAVFKLAVKVLEQVAHEALEKAHLKPEQIDWLVPHQANIRIMEGTAKKMGMSMDKVIVTVHEHGNTSAASIPLALDAGVRSGQIKRGQHLLLEGVGGGFAWGAAVLKY